MHGLFLISKGTFDQISIALYLIIFAHEFEFAFDTFSLSAIGD